jgi:hypothetical protein
MSSVDAGDRALWVWDTPDPERLIEFATAGGIGRLFVAVPERLGASPDLERLRRVAALAADAGITVDALGGGWEWIDRPGSIVDEWLTPVMGSGLFHGVHADVEPHAHPRWDSDRDAVIHDYLGLLDELVATCSPAAPLEVDLAFWYQEIAVGDSTLDVEVLCRVHGATILAYRNRAGGVDGTIAIAERAFAAATAHGRPVRIGQETKHLGDDPVARKQTFYGHTIVQMDRELAAVSAAFAPQPVFAGIAIHDHTGYAAMSCSSSG